MNLMKFKVMVFALVGILTSCVAQTNEEASSQETGKKATVVELVLWKPAQGTSSTEAREAAQSLNDFVRQQPGFISRTTAQAADGQFLDVVYWTDLKSATQASEKAMQNEKVLQVFSTMDEKTMIFKHFDIWNTIP